ncbi:MAG: phage virion morphogenesis protein [Thiobacillaceae bacterium]|jgi:phage gpG-like protein|nr:phage virion morphogenesis protein [Thiobacillaceae bacterium]
MPTYPPFSIEVQDAAVRTALTGLLRRLGNLTPAMQDIGRALANIAEDAFQSETDPWGNPWDELTAAYVARPRDKGGRGGDAHPILQRDGGLAASLSHGGDRTSAWAALGKVYGAAVTLGYPEGGIPERLVLPMRASGELAPVARDEVLETVADYLMGRP